MLANALYFVALIAVAAMTFLSAGLAMTRAASTRLAQSYLTEGYQRAVSALQQSVAQEIQTTGSTTPLPVITPLPAQCAGGKSPCRYETSATISFLTTAAPAVNEQANAYVNEGRIAARITAIVTNTGGMQLATRESDVALRTIATAPYVLISAARDGTLDSIPARQRAGDDGGVPPATPDPCGSAGAGASEDTAIRVAYENAATNACSDGSAWRSPPYPGPTSAPGWSP